MNVDEQLFYFQETGIWLESEKRRLLGLIRSRKRAARARAWKALLEIADRTACLNRDFEKFLAHSTPDAS